MHSASLPLAPRTGLGTCEGFIYIYIYIYFFFLTREMPYYLLGSGVIFFMEYKHASFHCASDIVLFTNGTVVATLHWASLSAPFFQQQLFTWWLWVTLWSFSRYFRLLISSFISSVISWLLRSVLFNLHVFVFFTDFFL